MIDGYAPYRTRAIDACEVLPGDTIEVYGTGTAPRLYRVTGTSWDCVTSRMDIHGRPVHVDGSVIEGSEQLIFDDIPAGETINIKREAHSYL